MFTWEYHEDILLKTVSVVKYIALSTNSKYCYRVHTASQTDLLFNNSYTHSHSSTN